MRDFAPPPVEDEPARHTVTVGGATATVVDPPREDLSREDLSREGPSREDASRDAAPRRARFVVAAMLGAAAGLGAFAAWPRHVEELTPPPRAAAITPPAPQPLAAHVPPAPPPVAPSLMMHAHKPPAAPPKKAPTPDLVDGKLLNPFHR
jgi:hypothetical protein